MNKKPHARPNWHVDLKWIFGIAAMLVLAVFLASMSLFRLTDRDRSIEIVSVGIATAFSPEGLDEAESIEEIKTILEEQPEGELQLVQGIEVVVRADDIRDLSPRDARLYVFRQIAEPLYDNGIEGVSELSSDPTIQAALRNDIGLIAIMNAHTHRVLGWTLAGSGVLALVLLGLSILWSYRFGRMVTAGVILLLVSGPGAVGSTIMRLASRTAPEAVVPVSAQTISFDAVLSEITPLIISRVQLPYVIAFSLGVLLLIGALVGHLIVRRKKHQAKATSSVS